MQARVWSWCNLLAVQLRMCSVGAVPQYQPFLLSLITPETGSASGTCGSHICHQSNLTLNILFSSQQS